MAPGTDLSFLASEIETVHDITLPPKPAKVPIPTPLHGTNVLNPSHITTKFDSLRFEAAAYTQLDVCHAKETDLSSYLISSPYNNPGHYLDLTTLDTPDLLLAKALTILKPLRSDYSTAPYTEALNLSSVVDLVRTFAADEEIEWKEQTFYVVSFRSKLKEVIDNELLYKLDYESHGEACESGGLLKYWFGGPDGDRRNLATCEYSLLIILIESFFRKEICHWRTYDKGLCEDDLLNRTGFWRSREDARLGGLGPWHKKARMAGRELYDTIVFTTHRFVILDGATDFTFEDWV